ncbi:MAG: hypothetical protein HY961_00710 [Ignavibacteriae bacterium]|nr:hypothetical protein [Ignavibacteriota bacterium]
MRGTLHIALLSLVASLLHAQPSGTQILKNIEANFSDIQDFSVDLEANVDLERLKVPKMKATMYFKKPDRIRFVSEGFALLPKEGVGFTPSNLLARFDVENVKEENSEFILTLHPKKDKTKLKKVFMIVDSSNWTVKQLTTPQFDGRQMKAEFHSEKVTGHWFPSQLHVTFSSDSTNTDLPEFFGQLPQGQRPSQNPRKGTITVSYSNYRLNTGLKDEFFEEEREKK